MKITIRFLRSTGTYAIFHGSKNHGSNSISLEQAVRLALNKFPGCAIVVKPPAR